MSETDPEKEAASPPQFLIFEGDPKARNHVLKGLGIRDKENQKVCFASAGEALAAIEGVDALPPLLFFGRLPDEEGKDRRGEVLSGLVERWRGRNGDKPFPAVVWLDNTHPPSGLGIEIIHVWAERDSGAFWCGIETVTRKIAQEGGRGVVVRSLPVLAPGEA